jgi:hypothetical protein
VSILSSRKDGEHEKSQPQVSALSRQGDDPPERPVRGDTAFAPAQPAPERGATCPAGQRQGVRDGEPARGAGTHGTGAGHAQRAGTVMVNVWNRSRMMSQTKEGAIKVAAIRIGTSVEEHTANVASGLKYCHACKTWHPQCLFCADASRYDGLAAVCSPCRNAKSRAKYVRKSRRPAPGKRRFAPARDGDKEQARGRVNWLCPSAGVCPPTVRFAHQPTVRFCRQPTPLPTGVGWGSGAR